MRRSIYGYTKFVRCSSMFMDYLYTLLYDNIFSMYHSKWAVSWVSTVYGGRGSDIHIARYSGFLDLLGFFNHVMADRGFKIKTDLSLKQCSLIILPSTTKGSQMVKKDVHDTSILQISAYILSKTF